MDRVSRQICLAICLASLVEVGLCQAAGYVRGTRPECQRALDVVFLLQSGFNVSYKDWNSTLHCVANVTTELRPSSPGTHVGVMIFATRTSVAQHLGPRLQDFDDEIRLKRLAVGRKRDLATALRSTRAKMFNNEDGDRSEVPDVLVVITHSVSDDVAASRQAAEELKSDGIRIITVGIGGQVDEMKRELKSIASYPDETNMLISAHGYKHLVNPLVWAICRRESEEQEGAIRLADEHLASGRLEVFARGEWVTVCSTSWSAVNTDVACRQLGFPRGSNWYSVSEDTYSPRNGIGNVTCTGHELRLVDCPHDPVFQVDPVCDHQHDVFLTCACANCRDYRIRDNVRLVGGGSTYGRLEVFSPRDKWGGICRDSWDAAATRVACRQLGFLDGAGTYDAGGLNISSAVHEVSCAGNESSLFDCFYATISKHSNCSGGVNVLCQCSQCIDRHLLRSPREVISTAGSSVQFEWKLTNSSGGDFEFWFLSRKNRRLVLRRRGSQVTFENTALRHRVRLIGDNEMVLGFILSNASRDDMGTYVLHVPRLRLFNSEAILFVTDFAVVPDPVVHCKVGESVELSWDFTALRQLTDIMHGILLSTPTTGRVRFSYYHSHWLADNPGRHSASQAADRLHPTIVIDGATTKDTGNYTVELNLTSSVHRWLDTTWTFTTTLIIDIDIDAPVQSAPVTTIVLGTLLGAMTLVVCGLLVRVCCKRDAKDNVARIQRRMLPSPDNANVNQRIGPPIPPKSVRNNPVSSARYRQQEAPPNDKELGQDYTETQEYDDRDEEQETNFSSVQQSQHSTVFPDIDIQSEHESSPEASTVSMNYETVYNRRQQFASSSTTRRVNNP